MRTTPLLDADKVRLPDNVALSPADESSMRQRLALVIHQSMCWVSGTPTPEGYVWHLEDHEPGWGHGRCGDALDILATYGNWRYIP